ncbi:MAG: hypothetical protein FJ091_15920 [Deltaproteobacteria bacterium]|nr:hypothetical protein [Deltaproteobacteria bacterium]
MRLSRRGLFGVALAALLALGALYELWIPGEIAWEPAQLGALTAERADGLVLQDARGGEVWASRGYGLYRSRAGGAFERVAAIKPRLGPAWAGYSRTFRDSQRYQELVEAMALDERTLLVFAGGDAYRVDTASGGTERVHTLRYFGPGRGRGLMPHGLTRDASGAIYYGEYATGAVGPDETIRVWRSRDAARTWEMAHEFAPGAVRHVHAVQWDPHGAALWVATGDRDAECRIGYSRDGGASFTWVGAGSQTFRAVSFLFTHEAVTWAMDSPRAVKRVVRWERASGALRESRAELPHPGYYAAARGGERGVITLAETSASLWLVERGEPRLVHEWAVTPDASRPHPAVRLLRPDAQTTEALLVNPLRTREREAAILRLSLESLAQEGVKPSHAQAAVRAHDAAR